MKPPSVAVQAVPGPSVGSPRSTITLWTPPSAYARRIARSSSAVWPTQVRCAIGVSDVSFAIREVTRMVPSRVVPPAP